MVSFMTDKIKIYEYKVEDVENSLRELWLCLAREMFEAEQFILPSEANANKWLDFIRQKLIDETGFLLIAKNNDKIVGFAYWSIPRNHPLQVSKNVGVLNDVYVSPKFRGKGIGTRLVHECMKRLEMRGVDAVRLSVLSENKTATKLYEKLGFRIYRHEMMKDFKH